MKKSRERETRRTERVAAAAAVAKPQRSTRLPYWLAFGGALVLVFWAYGPALNGAFLFDDSTLQFALPNANAPFTVWMHNLRPLLMATYWLNARISGDDPFSYHVLNVLIHFVTSGLIFLIVRRLAEWARTAHGELLAGFAALVFLLHPIQAEAVAYLAGRSEAFSVMLAFAAFTIFLYRKDREISWGKAAAILVLFVAALLSKEHTVALPALLLLTDYWWNPGFSWKGARGNWKLYVPMALGAVGGVIYFLPVILHSSSAGFGFKTFTWYQYFFTECRALFVYVGEFLLPVRLTADWDFAISKTAFDHGAVIGLLALVALAAAAWYYRRRFPLASYGFFCYLLLMAPTSSIMPIADPVAERRIYFSMLGLLLIVVDIVSRLHIDTRKLAWGLAAILLMAMVAAHARAAVWADPLSLWQDTVRKSPDKRRVHFQLGSAYFDAGRCDQAIREYQKAAQLGKVDYDLLIDWGLTYDCLNDPTNAVAKLRQAAALDGTAHVYSQIGMVYAKRAQWGDAMQALAAAEKIDPNYAMTYYYKGGVYLSQNMAQQAAISYQRSLQLQPGYQPAIDGLRNAVTRLRGGR